MKALIFSLCLLFVLTGTAAESPFMTVSTNGHYLVGQDGKPFFYLADAAWRYFYLTDKEMAEHYMRTRKALDLPGAWQVRHIGVDLSVLNGPAKLTWYDVRTGDHKPYSDKLFSGVQTIFPPEDDTDGDYVLIAETE